MWTKLRTLLVPFAAVLLVLTACTADVDSGPVSAAPAEADGDVSGDGINAAATCAADIAAALEGWEAAGFSGTVAFVDGDRSCSAAYGMADPAADRPMTVDTTFSIGSITKAVTAAAIGGLAADGQLGFEDSVSDHLPQLTGPVGEATIGQLLLHTSGVTGSHGRDHEPLSKDEAITNIDALELATTPGEEFLYANAGYATLALIVDEVTGSFRAHLRDSILVDGDGAPLGGFWNGEPAAPAPRAVGVTDDGAAGEDGSFDGPHWGLDGSGGVAMTADELASWTSALFKGEIINRDAVAQLLDLRFDQGDGTAEVPGWVSVDAEAFGEPLFGTSGGGGDIGHEMTVAYLPETDRVFVIASNTPAVRAEGVLEQMIGALVAGETPPSPPTSGALDADLAADLVGTWEFGNGGRFEISADDGAVLVQPLNAEAMPLLLPVPNAEDAAAHEQLVLDVIDGSTEEGRNERRLLEEAMGPIESVEVLGTWFAEFEYRTLLSIGFANDRTRLWLALDDAGGIAAAEVGTPFPSIRFLPNDDGSVGPIDRVSVDLGIRITVVDMLLEVRNSGATETARRAG